MYLTAKQGNSSGREEILRHLDDHGVECKDAAEPVRPVPGGCRKKKGLSAHYVLDLHGMTAERAERAVRTAFEHCRRTGRRSLLLVHGTGMHSDPSEGPVLGPLVAQMLKGELAGSLTDYRKAPPPLGGNGATLVYLR